MALKLVNDEEKEKNVDDTRMTAVSGQASDMKKEPDNPWDYYKPEEPVVVRSISSTVPSGSPVYESRGKSENSVIKIGRIVVYICMLFMIVTEIWICTQPKVDIYYKMMPLSPIYSFCGLFIIVDAVLVNVLYEKKISLILWSLFFSVVYPAKRDKHVNGGSSIGTLCSLACFVVSMVLGVNLVSSILSYGSLVMNPSQEARTEGAAFLAAMQGADGENWEQRLKRSMQIEDMQVDIQDSGTMIVVSGNGKYGVEDDTMINYGSNQVPTQIGFQKKKDGSYEMVGIAINNRRLTDSYAEYHFNVNMK